MALNLQTRPRDLFNSLYQDQCTTNDGRLLAQIIDRNEHAMIQASLLGLPAMTPLLAVLTPELTTALENDDRLLNAFGYMVSLEMEFLGFQQIKEEQQTTRWPYTDRESQLAVFRHGGT